MSDLSLDEKCILLASNVLSKYEKCLKGILLFIDARIEHSNFDLPYSYLDLRVLYKEEVEEFSLYKSDLSGELPVKNIQYYKATLSEFALKYKRALSSMIGFLSEEINWDTTTPEKPLLTQQIIRYEDELHILEATVKRISSAFDMLPENDSVPTSSGYNKKSGWSEKINHVLHSKEQLLNLNQILEELVLNEPKLLSRNADQRNLKKTLSGLLKYYVNQNKLKRVESKDAFLYGLPDWFDNDNKVYEQYISLNLNND